MNGTMIVFSYTQQFQPRAVTNFYRSSMVLKIRSFNNLIQLDIASLLTLEWAKFLRTSYPTESLLLDQHAAKQDCSWDKSTLFGTQQGSVTSTTLWLKKDFAINPTYRRCLRHWKQWRFMRVRMVFLPLLYPDLAVDWTKWIGKKLWNYYVISSLMLTCKL